ncbi:MAG: glycosyltransferase family 2 protein [Solirubrobacterales bacterium]
MDPAVSVVLPTQNRSSMLRQALRSALDQEGVGLEMIVVDDGSSDDTPEVLERVEDERLRVIRHERAQGVSRARNAGIERANGEWIAFLDDDDLWAPGKLRAHLDQSAEGGWTFSYSGAIVIDERMDATRRTHPPGGDVVGRLLLGSNVIGSPSAVLLRADLLELAGGFDERLPQMEDWDLWIRAASVGRPGLVPEPLVAYREHSENARMASGDKRLQALFELMRDKHAAAARQAGVKFGDAWLDRWTASQDVDGGRRLRATARYLRAAGQTRTPRDLARALAALGGDTAERLGRRLIALKTRRPDWLDRYA